MSKNPLCIDLIQKGVLFHGSTRKKKLSQLSNPPKLSLCFSASQPVHAQSIEKLKLVGETSLFLELHHVVERLSKRDELALVLGALVIAVADIDRA